MTKKHIDKLSSKIAENLPIVMRTYLSEILNYLNDKGMLHPPHDDTFLWDKEIIEQEYPNVVAQIRKEEREKVVCEIEEKISEVRKNESKYLRNEPQSY